MERIGAWRVTDDGPVQLGSTQIELEKHLEDWIERDPRLAGEGLRIVARQLTVEGGGRLDLLAVEPQGRLVVIEVKRAKLEDVALTQALTYAAVLAREATDLLLARITSNAADRGITLPEDLGAQLDVPEGDLREVISVVIGAGFGVGTEALLDYLSGQFGVPIRAVSLQVFDVGGGEPLLIREITEVEQAGVTETTSSKYSIEAVTAYATEMGVGPAFEAVTAAVKRNDAFHPRPYLRCIMCAPVARRNRVLFTYEPTSKSRLRVYVALEAFGELVGVSGDRVLELLAEHGLPTPDDTGYLDFPAAEVDAFCGFVDAAAAEAAVPEDTDLSPTQALYRDWWTEFIPALNDAHPGWSAATKPQTDSWMNLPAGRTGIHYSVNFCGQSAPDKYLRAELYIDPAGGGASTVFEALKARKGEIEAAFGGDLSWEPLDDKQACRVAAYSPWNATVAEKDRWPEYRSWVLDAADRLRKAMGPALDAVLG